MEIIRLRFTRFIANLSVPTAVRLAGSIRRLEMMTTLSISSFFLNHLK